ncbi:uncharacterized protein LOC131856465 [Cryptomeria japonica]|uniref:uncharacterized protein LOC131856465 n=1 Tax=Cryptomeria japonica TaxID=3369 RepID=UPI0027DAB21C|nr:uncharacterized protein LOC131856465 [Cryptomeria japonica]
MEIEGMETTHEDTNLDSEVLYIMNIYTQEVNIAFDKESSEKSDVATEPLVEDTIVETNVEDIVEDIERSEQQTEQTTDTRKADTIGIHIDVSTEQPTSNETEKPTESLPVDSTEAPLEKLAETHTEK